MSTGPHNFVLIHGAWHGGWAWRDVAPRLRALGHQVTAPTMTGLGDRRHLAQGPIDLETHIEDIATHIEMEDLHGVTLVGWSYGGMVATGVLARMPARIERMIYLDAFVPADGKSLVDYVAPEMRGGMDEYKQRNEPLPPIPLPVFGVTDPAVAAFVEPRLTVQPWQTFYQPVKALKQRPSIPMSYIVCTGFSPSPFQVRLAEMQADPGMTVTTLDADHLCLLSAPEATVAALVS
ncbi:MAG TPA: alpha/beta hydrolase [Aliidongia sp.]|nr:alpha/beta hydrolase [Aliidongia sp.]